MARVSVANKPIPESADQYLRSFPLETQQVLEEVRAQIRSLVPGATETISYGILTFELNGRYLVYLAGWKKHISVYPVSAGIADALGDEIQPYLNGKGTLKFPLARPLPTDLIRRFVELREQEAAVHSRARG